MKKSEIGYYIHVLVFRRHHQDYRRRRRRRHHHRRLLFLHFLLCCSFFFYHFNLGVLFFFVAQKISDDINLLVEYQIALCWRRQQWAAGKTVNCTVAINLLTTVSVKTICNFFFFFFAICQLLFIYLFPIIICIYCQQEKGGKKNCKSFAVIKLDINNNNNNSYNLTVTKVADYLIVLLLFRQQTKL